MKSLTTALLALVVAFTPLSAPAETLSDTATLTVVVPPMPMAALVSPTCTFLVTPDIDETHCTITIVVADPTLRNQGWDFSLGALRLDCSCDGELSPNLLSVEETDPLVVLNGQPIDDIGGPRIDQTRTEQSIQPTEPLLTALPGFGNGAYSLDLTLRLAVPPQTEQGTYIPTWVIGLAPRPVL